MPSKIEWLDGGETWNPIRVRRLSNRKRGWHCVHASPGCKNCYAERQNVMAGSNRTRYGTGLHYNVENLAKVEFYLDRETLVEPLSWKKPKLIFPCSMTDWCGEFIPLKFRIAMMVIMAATPHHTYLTLTKRAREQKDFLLTLPGLARNSDSIVAFCGGFELPFAVAAQTWHLLKDGPLPNHCPGISVENQLWLSKRIDDYLGTPATLHWLSLEPLLDYVNLREVMIEGYDAGPVDLLRLFDTDGSSIGWLVPGGESGPNARPCYIDYIKAIVGQGQAAGIPVFVKQLGSKPMVDSVRSLKLNTPKGGNPAEWPKELQVRQYPDLLQRKVGA